MLSRKELPGPLLLVVTIVSGLTLGCGGERVSPSTTVNSSTQNVAYTSPATPPVDKEDPVLRSRAEVLAAISKLNADLKQSAKGSPADTRTKAATALQSFQDALNTQTVLISQSLPQTEEVTQYIETITQAELCTMQMITAFQQDNLRLEKTELPKFDSSLLAIQYFQPNH